MRQQGIINFHPKTSFLFSMIIPMMFNILHRDPYMILTQITGSHDLKEKICFELR